SDPMGFSMRAVDLLGDPMLRLHHDWAERNEGGGGSASIVQGDDRETGVAECFYLGIQLFKMTAERFFAFIQTAAQLKLRGVRAANAFGSVNSYGIERLPAK